MSRVHLDHFQIAIPAAGEDRAREFYGGLLGLREVAKPAALAGRGGLWFVLDEGIGLHLGVETPFRPATKTHPGLLLQDFDTFKDRLAQTGRDFLDERDHRGRDRLYLQDPFGNRIEVIRDTC